jgi:hypothetical protein
MGRRRKEINCQGFSGFWQYWDLNSGLALAALALVIPK